MAKKVLFIEDEPTLQKTVGHILEQEGYEVINATDGEMGLAKAKDVIPDVILLDLILPKMDGFEVLAGLKKDPATKEVPVLVLTNLESAKDVERALALGATNYLVKANYELEEVVEKVKESIK